MDCRQTEKEGETVRMVDADALSAEVDKSKYHNPHPQITLRMNHTNEHDHFIKMIYDAPTVDAVEVVRCRDCKNKDDGICWKTARPIRDDGFCEEGERKE